MKVRKDNNVGLYVGLLLVLGGIVAFLDLNGLLPTKFLSQYVSLIMGIALFIAFLRTQKFSVLMTSSFFVFNGILLLVDQYVQGWNYFTGIFIIPGLMFMVAFIAKRVIGYLIPGALLTSWGIFLLLITADVISGFSMIMGMGFIFTALAFFLIFLYDQEAWAGVPSLVLSIVGVIIITMGLGEVARLVLFNMTAVSVVLIGLVLIGRSFLKGKKSHDEEE